MCNVMFLCMMLIFLASVLVTCPPLTHPNDGMINCSLGSNNIPNLGEKCIFTCNIGYKLTGSSTRTCQSGGSWNGSDAVCRRGEWFLAYNIYMLYNENVVNMLLFISNLSSTD